MASRLTPSLFEKLVGDLEIDGMISEAGAETPQAAQRVYSVARLERFNEQAMRATVMRDLNWLLSTVHLAATVDLAPYPEVARSVLNYGVSDLAGRTNEKRLVQARARQIRDAIRTFEPRMDPQRLEVEPLSENRPNALTYLIRCDIVSAVRAMPVQFKTEIEVDSGAASVRD